MDSQTRRWRGGPAIAVVIVILLPVLYVLSVGPAVTFVRMTGTENELGPALEMFYYPVIWLHTNTPLQKPIEIYVEFWANLF
jgi:hypothetical protein